MKRICTALMALALAVPMLLADGPDDLFIRVYALIQQGDASQANGQLVDAAAKYTEAKAVLDKLQAIYPKWNEKIVSYRQGYLAEQLARLPAVARPPATPAASTTQPATAAAGPAPEQLSALDKEVRALREERD